MTGPHLMTYQPALDGLRAVAVVVVLLFHLEIGWASGGYLGVSVFFTLSGFLITSLLLEEHRHHGRVDVRRFYARRARRLLPASMVTLAAVCVLALTGLVDARSTLRGDLLGALLQVKNWSALSSELSYSDLFAGPSPVDHFWSLSVEEQFYLLWPLTIAFIARGTRTRGQHSFRRTTAERSLRVTAYLVAAFAISAPLTRALWSADAAYLVSWTRFAEILAGALLAAFLYDRSVPAWGRHLAPAGLAVVLALCVVSPAGRGWAYDGGLPLFALVSVAVIAGLQVPGVAVRALSWRPVVWVGKVSFGLYLYHWPVYVVLDEGRTGLTGLPLMAVRLLITVGIAAVSHQFLERPIRYGEPALPDRRVFGGIGLAAAAVGVIALVAVPRPTVVDAAGSLSISGSTPMTSPPPAPLPEVPDTEVPDTGVPAAGGDDPTPAPEAEQGPLPLVMVGDSVAHTLAGGRVREFPHFDPWDSTQSPFDPATVRLLSIARPGCSFLPGRVIVGLAGVTAPSDLATPCGDWRADLDAALAAVGPGSQLVVVLANDAFDREGEDGGMVPFASSGSRRLLRDVLDEMTATATGHGAEVVLIGLPERLGPDAEGFRDRRMADLMEDYASDRPGVRFVDFGGVSARNPEWRYDGLHYTPEGARAFAEWLTRRLDRPTAVASTADDPPG